MGKLVKKELMEILIELDEEIYTFRQKNEIWNNPEINIILKNLNTLNYKTKICL